MTSRALTAIHSRRRRLTHGARKFEAQLRRGKVDNRFKPARTRSGIAFVLATALVPWTEEDDARVPVGSTKTRLKAMREIALDRLDPVKRERVEAAADLGAVYMTMRNFVFQQPTLMVEGELLPCLRKSFLAYGNAWRRELRDNFNFEPEKIELTLSQYLAAAGSAQAAPGSMIATPDGSQAAPEIERVSEGACDAQGGEE